MKRLHSVNHVVFIAMLLMLLFCAWPTGTFATAFYERDSLKGHRYGHQSSHLQLANRQVTQKGSTRAECLRNLKKALGKQAVTVTRMRQQGKQFVCTGY